MLQQALQGDFCDSKQPVWTNRIQRDDCVGILGLLVSRALEGMALEPIYLATDDGPATMSKVLEWMKNRIGDAGPGIFLGRGITRRSNHRCSNHRIKALGYEFVYPNYREGYNALLNELGY